MLRITAISAGAVEYLIRGNGCTHEHDGAMIDLDAAQDVADGAEAGAGRGVSGRGVDGAAGYFDAAVRSGEVPGRWLGSGLAMVGAHTGQEADPEAVRAVFGRVEQDDRADQGATPSSPVPGAGVVQAVRRRSAWRGRRRSGR